jgi:hypothetical protein
MQLVKIRTGRRRSRSREDAVILLRDLGDRLDHVLGSYGRLVSDLADEEPGIPDFAGRVDLLSTHLAFVAQRLQEVLILRHEATRAEVAAASASIGRPPAFARPAERAMA